MRQGNLHFLTKEQHIEETMREKNISQFND